ncbi:MAG: PilZ domain-containing protein [Acidobacteriota bacterium]
MQLLREHRLDPRVRTQHRIELRMDGSDEWRSHRTVNLSVNGARCCGREALAPRAMLEVRLWLPDGADGERVLRGGGRVVHGHVHFEGRGGVSSYEYGLVFENWTSVDRAVLRDFLFDIMAGDSTDDRPRARTRR